jgi:hypothetical protein
MTRSTDIHPSQLRLKQFLLFETTLTEQEHAHLFSCSECLDAMVHAVVEELNPPHVTEKLSELLAHSSR